MRRLGTAARAHRDAIEELIRLGAVESRTLVGDLGERLAADYYGVNLEPAVIKRGRGYDLHLWDGRRVEVKTLRCTPSNWRRSIGPLTGNYDLLFAIRLDEDYLPLEAIEVPRQVVEEHYPRGTRVTWTKKLEADARTRKVAGRYLDPSR